MWAAAHYCSLDRPNGGPLPQALGGQKSFGMQKITAKLLVISIALLPLIVVAADPPAVEEGKGLVVLYRMSKAKGAAVRFNMTSTSGFSGSLVNGSWMFEQLEPGEYTYSVSSPSLDGQDSITVNVAEGQTYYMKGEIKWGWPAGRAKFTMQSEASGQTELAKIK
jgi:hypothetical protein